MSKFRTTYGDGYSATRPMVKNAIAQAFTTTAGGDCTYVFPTPFPNALVGVQLTDASTPGVVGPIVLKMFIPAAGVVDRTQVKFRAYDTAGAVVPSFPINVNITAWGY